MSATTQPVSESRGRGMSLRNRKSFRRGKVAFTAAAAAADDRRLTACKHALAGSAPIAATATAPNSKAIEIWESEETRPAYCGKISSTARDRLERSLHDYLSPCMQHPFRAEEAIRAEQLARIKELVTLAYRDIPVYRDKYLAAGFSPAVLNEWADIQKIPVITKAELIAAFPDRCLNPKFDRDDLFPTRSSGSSGQTLLIRVNLDAIVKDTIQGVRQFALQSGLKYAPTDLLCHVYTVPWWFPAVGQSYETAFISSVIPPARVAEHLHRMQPQILSCYPSNLAALLPHADKFKSSTHLVVTHSEHSAPMERQKWSRQLGVPVCDEYSSEEATRIALELPCGHYHVCEDSVHLDVLDPDTMQPQIPGQPGVAVITNLLNEAMPFIRYLQGDYITVPANPAPCGVRWSQIEAIGGRANDAFVTKSGRQVPAGTILDITYRWMFDRNIHLAQFEIVQKRTDLIHARLVPGKDMPLRRLKASVRHLEELLSLSFEYPVTVKAEFLSALLLATGKKRRPIRRELEV